MFLPGYTGPVAGDAKGDDSWRTFKRQARAAHVQRTPAERAKLLETAREFDRRGSRARAAQAAGAKRAEVIAIMEKGAA